MQLVAGCPRLLHRKKNEKERYSSFGHSISNNNPHLFIFNIESIKQHREGAPKSGGEQEDCHTSTMVPPEIYSAEKDSFAMHKMKSALSSSNNQNTLMTSNNNSTKTTTFKAPLVIHVPPATSPASGIPSGVTSPASKKRHRRANVVLIG